MDEFTDSVLTPMVEIPTVIKKSFMPWHKPRKHWCRYNQWISGLNWVVDSIGADRLNSFKYLGLPGDDLLDLRLFAYSCKTKNIQLKYLGFNSVTDKSDSSTELNISESELRMTGVIEKGSKVITEPLETLSELNSSAFVDAESFCGFHMINLDLCKSITKADSDNSKATLKALYNVLESQLNYMREPWTLFITTNVSKESVIADVMDSLLQAIKDNNDSYVEFATQLEEKMLITTESVESAISNVEVLSIDEFLDCFTLGLSKSILKATLSIGSWSIEMTESCKYRTGDDGGSPDMISLGFRFRHIHQPAVDPFDLVGINAEPEIFSELEIALQLVDQVEGIFNLDSRISNSPDLKNELTEHSANLLEVARYDRNEYMQWVGEGCPSKRFA